MKIDIGGRIGWNVRSSLRRPTYAIMGLLAELGLRAMDSRNGLVRDENRLEQGYPYLSVIVGVSHDLRGLQGFVYHDPYLGGKALIGLRVANSHTGNHREDDFTLLETIRRFLGVTGSRSLSSSEGRHSSRIGGSLVSCGYGGGGGRIDDDSSCNEDSVEDSSLIEVKRFNSKPYVVGVDGSLEVLDKVTLTSSGGSIGSMEPANAAQGIGCCSLGS
ncbi:hypothetical protein Tco_0810775 [Tanacetum coccineum]